MKSASISEIKKELKAIEQQTLVELCIRISKYKKDNKEFLNYLLFEAHDPVSFRLATKEEMSEQFLGLNKSQVFLAKKTVRKVLRTANKYIKYAGDKETEIELLMHFCKLLQASGMLKPQNKILLNIYQNQYKKLSKAMDAIHEDLRFDYEEEFLALDIGH